MKVGASTKLQPAEKATLKSLVNDLIPLFRAAIQAPGFWTNHVKVSELEGEVYSRLVDTGIDAVLEHLDEWSKALVHLAKSRSHDLLS
jgi:hypothetical protein